MKKKLLTNKSGRVRELSGNDMKNMRPAADVLPKTLLDVLPKRKRGQRGPQISPIKKSITLRYSPEVVSYFKSTGKGWQTRIDDVLKKWVKRHSTSKNLKSVAAKPAK